MKINSVIMPGVNEDDILPLAEFGLYENVELRFIEQMPLGPRDQWDRSAMVTAQDIIDVISTKFDLTPDTTEETAHSAAPATMWRISDGNMHGKIGIIASVTRPFCGACDRTRLTSDGAVRSCLFSQTETSLRDLLRQGRSDNEIAEAWAAAMWLKPAGHGIDDPSFVQPHRPMSAIGGEAQHQLCSTASTSLLHRGGLMGEQHRRTMDEHLQAALALVAPLQHTVQVSTRDLNDHHGIVVARDVMSAAAIPPFTNSAMDGFLVHRADIAGDGPWTFPVSGDIPAGSPPVPVPAGHAVRIMTGAPVPEDPDTKCDELCVIPIENTDARNDVMPTTVTVKDYNPHRAHIRHRGEHVQPGDVVTHAGTRIDAGVIATLISAGVEQVELYPRPTVCVITSGDEVGDARTRVGHSQLERSDAGCCSTRQRCCSNPPSCA